MSGDLAGRVVLVVGASHGLGAALAPLLAAAGAHPVLLGRAAGALEEVDDRVRAVGGTATLVPLDLRDGDAVDRLGPSIYARFGRLDGLVHTATVLQQLTPVAHGDPAWFSRMLEVNLVAAARVIRTTEPLLRRSDAGRAVFVTCGVARAPRAYLGHIAAAKAGLEALVRSWALEVAKTPLRVNLFDPGPMATRFRRDGWPGEPAGRVPPPEAVAPRLLPLLSPACTLHGELVEAGSGEGAHGQVRATG
ncbi:putative oxidoreductase YciK [bacterium HR39]|nr:putative oxidoreductase YciK [bacterium HR39]